MMDEFENSSVDLEQLLRSKSWSQLSGAEQTEALKFVSGREEYEQLHAMVHQLKTTAGVHDAEMKPSRDVRDNLLNAFDAEQRKRKAGWWTNVSVFLNETIRFDIPAVRFGVAAVLLFTVVFGAMKLNDSEGTEQTVAKHETKEPAPVDPGNTNPQQPNENLPVTPPQPENNVVQENNNVEPIDNQPQMVQAPVPMIQDTNAANRMAMLHDTDAVVMPLTVIATGGTNAFCCGTSNGTIVTTNSGVNYTWSNSNTFSNGAAINVAFTNGLPVRSRSLAEDAEVMDVFFAVK